MRASQAPKPFFETSPSGAVRRLLLVSYSFLPDASVGALRLEMMMRSAAAYGWSADVLLMDPSDSRDLDESRLKTLPPGIRLFANPFPRSGISAVARWRNVWLGRKQLQPAVTRPLSPDGTASPPGVGTRLWRRFDAFERDMRARNFYMTWQRWCSRVTENGVALARDTDYAFVLSSGPPHMAHEAARRIAVAIERPLVCDFRDPWTSADIEPGAMRGEVWQRLSNRFERACVEGASLIVANTDSARRLMSSKYPELGSRIITVRNGADGDPCSKGFEAPPYIISYTGSLYGGRHPDSLFQAVRRVVERGIVPPDQLVLHFMGVEEGQRAHLLELARREGIVEQFRCDTRHTRADAAALLDRSAILVVLPQIHVHSVPAKVYEYVQRAAWLLVLSEPGTAVVELLQDTTADIVSPHDPESIASILTERLSEARRGVRPAALNADGRFARERQAERFFGAIEQMLETATSTRGAEKAH